MADVKKSLVARIFGSKKPSCCCNIEIEEVPEEQNKDAGQEKQTPQGSACCDASRKTKQ